MSTGGGTIIGGCYQKGNWDSTPDFDLANRMLRRAVEFCPEFIGGPDGLGGPISSSDGQPLAFPKPDKFSIIRHGVGLRPLRTTGTRIEKEKIGEQWVVHNYGHGGYGYQSSYGCGKVAVALVDEVLNSGHVKRAPVRWSKL